MSRDRHITIRVTDDEHEEIRAAAEEADRSMSSHLRQSALSSGSTRVPPINETAWEQLAPVASNLNQLARRANRFRRHLEEVDDINHDTRKALVGLMTSTRKTVREMTEAVQDLRRDLYGAAPLDLAADVLDDWRRAVNLGRIDVDGDRLAELVDELRELAAHLNSDGTP